MKTALVFLVIGIVLLINLGSKNHGTFRKSTVDIHLYDTYFILNYFSFFIAILLILGTLFFFGGTIGTLFKNKNYLFPLLIFTMIDSYFIIRLIKLFNR